ncbi:GNAT family N-acetyltransferase [Streptomyces apocyni]|uniref:GNAT family N-acetyltransferase n=1 Tax=Streptomyces apocyni TaxID=2654677 RepID=UPI0012EAA7D2|nr:GNAT family N-acetyltransferase [Streptomyces apocyni]
MVAFAAYGPGWHFTGDLDVFLARAGGFFDSDPVAHTVLLSVTETLRSRGLGAYGGGAPLFGDLIAEGEGEGEGGGGSGEHGVVGAFVWTPPHAPHVSPVPAAAAAELAGHLRDQELAGVFAASPTAEAFAEAWAEGTGAAVAVSRQERLYRLETVTPPLPVPPGRARIATRADRGLLMRWHSEFLRGLGETTVRDSGAWVDSRLAYGGITLWETPTGEGYGHGAYTAVAIAGRTPLVGGQVRVGPVYTPPEQRGRGYARAVTTEVSRAGRAAGAAEVLLFADLANPTSNGVYQRVGFRPVRDFAAYAFAA